MDSMFADARPAAGHTSGPGQGQWADLLSRPGFEAQLRRPEGGRGRQEPGGAWGLHWDRDGGSKEVDLNSFLHWTMCKHEKNFELPTSCVNVSKPCVILISSQVDSEPGRWGGEEGGKPWSLGLATGFSQSSQPNSEKGLNLVWQQVFPQPNSKRSSNVQETIAARSNQRVFPRRSWWPSVGFQAR